MNPSSEYLTKPHANEIFDLKPRCLEKLIREGKVKAFKIGRKVLIERASIVEFIRSHEVTPTQQHIEKSALAELMDRAIEVARRKTS